MRHPHQLVAILLNQGTGALLLVVAGPLAFARLHEMHVDVKDELEVTRQDALEKRHTPPLQRFRQQRMVGIAESSRDDLPGFLPWQILLVDQEAQQIDDGDGRMGVVELNGDLVGEVVPRIARLLAVAADDVAQRAGDEKILLHEAQFLAVLSFVVRIKDL